MLYAIDTEFIENGRTIDLMSLGMVSADGQTTYVQNLDCDLSKANAWVREHVLPQLTDCPSGHGQYEHLLPTYARRTGRCPEVLCPWMYHDDISGLLIDCIGSLEPPVFWGYYCDYDWVALCQLFGTMMDLPKGWPMYCRDLRQWLDEHELEGIVQVDTDEGAHHALSDAQWIMRQVQRYVLGRRLE